MKLSVVTTLYCSAPYVEEFHRRATAAAREVAGDDYEIIMVNDGSPDNVLEKAVALTNTDTHLVVVDLSRNFGHHRAMMVGLQHSQGDYVFALDDDLEEEPEWLSLFWNRMQETQVDHVFGVQATRKGGWFERWSGWMFYSLFNWLSGTPIVPNQIMAKLMTRRFVNALLEYKERNIFLSGILALTGFSSASLVCKKKYKGKTTYTLRRKIDQAINSITSFSSRPLYLIFYFGIMISFSSLIFILYFIFRKLFFGIGLAGWTSLIAFSMLSFGIIISVLGIIGFYISKIFDEVKLRPYATIRSISHHDE